MRIVALLLVLALTWLAGCMAIPAITTSTSTSVPMRGGVVILNEPFRATQASPASFSVDVPAGSQRLQYEVTQDSGIVPNLHISLTGCGDATLPGSAGFQNGTLCASPRSGLQTLKVEITNLAAGTGRILLRADLPA